MTLDDHDVRSLLCALTAEVGAQVLERRDTATSEELAAVATVTSADTIYAIDTVGEDALLAWFERAWPRDVPVEIVAEGLDEGPVVCFGSEPAWTVVVDPIDGTRMLMYDKRSAWTLAGAAPRRDDPPTLADITAAAMFELPTRNATVGELLSATRGGGVHAERIDHRSGSRAPFHPRPSTASDLEHGFASFARFFPEGREQLVAFETSLWRALYPERRPGTWLQIFDDQYLATGGQCHELATGADRMVADLRPLVAANPAVLACHPYDACTFLVATELGVQITDPWGAPLRAPLDVTTPVAWVGYANAELAARVGPAFAAALDETF